MDSLKSKVFKEAGKQRLGRGLSRQEVKEVGLSLGEARRLGIPIDSRRRTAHKENVEAIKKFLNKKRAMSKAVRRKSKS